ncbi:YycC family protein [Cohnella caldifontis]|uniref:YycC family protein n=1 Tax=Cohnella caldifontis TaxID=3027471 RepID=UPI0023EAC33D|nr:YycC family protein [Cohnella sp. YIM B05605]
MPRLPISAETAVKLAAFMNVPLEHLMHMPQHVMLQKLAEMAMAEGAKPEAKTADPAKEAPKEQESSKDGSGNA